MSRTRDLLEKKRSGEQSPSAVTPATTPAAASTDNEGTASTGSRTRDLLNKQVTETTRDYSQPANAESMAAHYQLRYTGQATLGGKTYTAPVTEEARKEYEQLLKWERWRNAPQADDFAEKSAYVSTYNPENEKFNAWIGKYTDTGYGDIYYDYINQNQHAQERQSLQDVNAGGPGSLYATTHEYWKDLDDETIKTFNYIYATEGADAAYEYIDATVNKTYTGIEALGLGFLQGTGASSISAALGKGISAITGDEEMDQRNKDWYNQLLQETAAAAEEHPTASGVGVGAGALSTMMGIGMGVGSIPAVASLPTWVGGVISGAASMGGTTAIQEAGAAATGMMGPGDYALDVVTSTAGGAAGGLASAGAAAAGRTLLLNLGLTNNTLANSIVAGMSGTAYSLADTGVTEVSKYLRDSKNYELDERQVLQDAVVAFAFSSISYAIRAQGTASNAAPQEDPNARPTTTYFEDIDNIDDLKKAYRNLSKQHHPDLGGSTEVMAQINSEFEAMQRWLLNQSVSRAAAAYEQRERQAAAGQDTATADDALRKEAALIMGAVNDGTLTTADAAQAAEIIQAIATAGAAGGMVSAAGDVPTIPAVEPTTPLAPVGVAETAPTTDAQGIAAQLVSAGATQEEAESLAPVLDAVLAGEEISGNQAGAIAKNEVAVSVLESATGEIINTDAPLGEVKATIRSLASRQAGQTEQAPTADTNAPVEAVQAQEKPPAMEEVTRNNVQAVADFAKTMEKAGAAAMTQMYDGSQSAEQYVVGMIRAYNAGKNGTDRAEITNDLQGITAPQAQAAYLAGQADATSAQVAQNAEVGYTGGETDGLTALKNRLDGYNEAVINGVRYTISGTEGNYSVTVARADGTGGYVTDASAQIYTERGIETRDEAKQALLDVAAANNLTTTKEDAGHGKEEVDGQADPGSRGRGVQPREAGDDGLRAAGRRSGGLRDGSGAEPGADSGSGSGRNSLGGVSNGEIDSTGDAGAGAPERKGESGQADGGGGPQAQGTAEKGVLEPGVVAARRGGLSWAKDSAVSPKRGSVAANEAAISDGYNIKSYVVPNAAWDANKGSKTPAFSRGGEIFYRETIAKEHRGMVAEHEITHVMKQLGFRPYLDFIDRTADMLNMASEAARVLLEGRAEHRSLDLDAVLMGDDKQAAADRIKLFDELHATIYGHIAANRLEGLEEGLRAAFVDWDAYRAEITNLHEQFKAEQTGTAPDAEEITAPAPVEEQIAQKDELGNQEKPRGNNFVIGEKGFKFPSTPKARFKANTDAVKTLRSIVAEGRLATPEEQEVLAKYTGWGGLTNAFDESKADWAKEAKQLKKLLDEAEYKAAKASMLDAYYTEPGIIQGMYNGLAKLGFTGGRLLEPSAGVGRFLGAMPAEMLGGVRSWTAVELDKITGNIAKYLYPNADVRVQGFESANIPGNYMDVVIGNVPFGDFGVADKTYPASVTKLIHNYFVAKSLDKLRPGGIAALITSTGTLDTTGSEAARRYFMKQADLIGAIRLPNTAFQSTGTPVVSDILIFKKREANTPYKGEPFAEIGHATWKKPGMYGGYPINEYFVKHPEMVLGEAAYGTGSGGRRIVTFDPLEGKGSLQKQIEKAFSKIKAKMDYPVQKTQEEIRAEIKADAGKAKDGSIIRKDGKLYQAKNGSLEAVNLNKGDEARMTGIVEIRDAARALLDMQLDDAGAKAIEAQRKLLNDLYDKFVKANGLLSVPKNTRLLNLDADGPFVKSLEITDKKTGKTEKAAIFTKDTVQPNRTAIHADSVGDALTIVMNEIGMVDVGRIAQLTGESAEQVRRELLESRAVFKNRDGDLEVAETYLSGNVKAKLRDAEALAEGDPDYQRNVEELRKIIPADIAPEDISVRPGATWVPDATYSSFASSMLGGGTTYDYRRGGQVPSVEVKYNRLTGSFTVEINDQWLKGRAENISEWGTPDRSFVNIFEAMLNSKNLSVWRTLEDGGRVLDKQATAQVAEKKEKILAEFQRWIWADESRRTELGKLYNDVFNNSVTPKYDGGNLTVNGLNAAFGLRTHQADAVHRIVASGGNTLLAHKVGAGKTLEMAAAAMKLRQLGIVKKPVFVVPKSLAPQWAKEFLDYFPNAKILAPGENDFSAANRKTFVNRVATGDWDAVILSTEQFKRIPMSGEHQEAFYQQQIDALELAILESKRASGKDPGVRNMERSKKSLEAKLKKIGDMAKDKDNISFEQLGVDALFVDEAHQYKNLFYTSQMQNVSGLSSKEGSQQAFDLYMKVRYLQQLNGGRGIVFATATPVMNSMSEMYIMQRYLQGDLLEAKGLNSFDAWANQFGEVRTVLEMNPSGKGYRQKQSFSRFKNLAELQQMFRSFADVVTDLPLKLPKLKDGKRTVVECEPSQFQMDYIDELAKRADAIKNRQVKPEEDNMLKVTSDGRKLSYTQRMVDPSLPYEEEGKIVKCADNVAAIYKEYDQHKAAQLVFCDLSTPKGGSGADTTTPSTEPEDVQSISIYDDLKNMLIQRGIPAKEIAFIHDADTAEKKNRLFDDVNAGNVRVLIGSTGKMGVGMNAQERLIALHHLDAPWRPGDIEQREGRMLRQKNMFADLDIPVQSLVYITKKTFDSRMWDNLERKASFIHQVMAGDLSARESEGDGDFALSAAEIKAIASGNPLIMEQFEVAADLQRLETLERAHTKEVNEATKRITILRQEIAADEANLPKFQADAAAAQDTRGDKFTIQLGGKKLDERKAAGEAIVAATKKAFKAGEAEQLTALGKFAGFDLYVTNKGDMLLRGKAQYRGTVNMQSPIGTVTILENMAQRPAKNMESTQRRIEENKANVAKLEKVASAPFGKAAELQEKRLRNAEILAELNPVEDQNVAELDGEGGGSTQKLKDRTTDGQPHPERWTAQRVGDSNKAPKSVSEIIAGIEHDFGFNITRGHVRGAGVRGQFSQRDKGIRSKIANDLPTVCHELGHALDDRYGITGGDLTKDMHLELEKALGDLASAYKPKEIASEGLAEFLRQYLQNREVAAIDYPKFTEHFLSTLDGKDRALIQQLADEVNAYYSLDADSAASSVRLREEGGADLRTTREKIRQMGDEFYQAWVDSNHGIKLFDEATGSDVYKRATNAAYSDAIAGQVITGDLTDASGRYVGPGLKAALNGINTRDKKEYKAFGEYLIVRHGPERLAEGMRVFADDRKNSTAFMQRRQAELEAQYPEFKAASERLYQFIADLNQTWGVETGVIAADQLESWQKRWSHYVPFNRALEKTTRPGAKRGFANQSSPYKRAKGSGLDIVHPVDNVIDNIVLLVNVGVRNNVMRELRNSAIGLGADATWMEKVPTPLVPKQTDLTGVKAKLLDEIDQSSKLTDAGKTEAESIISSLNDVLLQFERGKAHGDVVTVMVNGKPEFWKINDKLLLESVTSMTPAKLHGFLEAYAFTTRFMTANITGNNPVWSIFSNAPRDLGTFAVYSKERRPFKAIAAIGSAYINSFKETVKAGSIDPLYAEYLAMGGGHTSTYSADADLAKKARKKLTYTKAQRVLDTVNPVNWVSFVSDTVEMGPRFATYKLMREAGLTPQEAFYEAMDVTTNFRRGGYMGRDVNKAVPFFNASVQGIDKFRRFFTGADAAGGERAKVVRNRWIAFFAASAALAALMYGINNGDDEAEEDYEQLSNYTKNSFWCIPLGDGKYFTIPKPRELAVLTSFMETCMERFVGGNEHAFDEFYQYFVENFLPSVVSDLAQLPSNIAESGASQGIKDTIAGMIGSAGLIGVGAYVMANRDFLGRPIDSALNQYTQSEAKDHYNASTSRMAYWLGQAFNLSPYMVDYVGNQVLGYLWKVPKALFPVGEDPDYSLGVKSTYVKDNAYSQDLVNWLYDRADETAAKKGSDPSNMDKAIEAKLDSSMTEFYGTFNKLNKGKVDSSARRNTRQIVLTMISEYRQAVDSGYTSWAQKAVYGVVRATGETKYMPSVMNDYVKDGDGTKHTLSDTQYVSYQTNYLNLYWSYVEENLNTGDSVSKRAAVLDAAKTVAKEQATNAVLRRIGASETSFAAKYGGVDDGDVIEYKARVATETDGTPKQDEAIAILEDMVAGGGTTKEEAYLLFRSVWSESDKNNPWEKYAP